jgi:hypothetical protein
MIRRSAITCCQGCLDPAAPRLSLVVLEQRANPRGIITGTRRGDVAERHGNDHACGHLRLADRQAVCALLASSATCFA